MVACQGGEALRGEVVSSLHVLTINLMPDLKGLEEVAGGVVMNGNID